MCNKGEHVTPYSPLALYSPCQLFAPFQWDLITHWCQNQQHITFNEVCRFIENIFDLALCVGNSPVTGEFPSQRPVTRSFDVFFDLHLNKRLRKQSRCRQYETPSCPLWCHCNVITVQTVLYMSCYIGLLHEQDQILQCIIMGIHSLNPSF